MSGVNRLLSARCRVGILLSVLLLSAQVVRGNEAINGYYRDYVRVLALLGKSSWTPRSFTTWSDGVRLANTIVTDHIWQDQIGTGRQGGIGAWLLAPEMALSFNTHLPHNRNNQSQWEGRGLNGRLTGGIGFQFGKLRGSLAPEFWFAQNSDFETLPSHASIESEWGDYFAGIDRPQRFGDNPVIRAEPGQTGIRFEYRNVGIALTNENMWLGPASQNAIVMSNNAAGFPRLEIGTAVPVESRLGRFEAATWWGRLRESDFFDEQTNNDHTFLLGYTIGYVPPVVTNFHLGFNRSYLSPWSTIDAFKVFQHFDSFFKNNRRDFDGGEDDVHQVASVTAHWFLPQAGFEIYLEWARNDHTSNLNDFIRNPEHSQAYTLGFRKAHDLGMAYLVVEGEITKLGNNETTTLGSPRPTFPYYRHGPVAHGYTNQGEVMGAWIGPGSNTQYFGVKGFFEWGGVDVGLRRVAWDQDYYLQFQPNLSDRSFGGYRVDLTGDVGLTVFFRDWVFRLEQAISHSYNHNWQPGGVWDSRTSLMARLEL